MSTETRGHNDYTIGWICALPLEMAAAKLMLDEIHPSLSQPRHDTNTYVLGKIANHNVAVACLPSGVYGTTSAAIVAKQMTSTFQSIQFGLMVGIGGGVPSSEDIRLGDIVVSQPTGLLPGVVQYDYGKTVESGRLQRTGTRNLPPQELLTALSHIESNRMTGNSDLQDLIWDVTSSNDLSSFHSPGPERDELFDASYRHNAAFPDCSDCDRSQLVIREQRSYTMPKVHCGTIASGNQVMKDGQTRDKLAQELGILCFEMEAAGLMDHFPCLVIRGICDYSDSHKNKDWQGYAAVTAAAYAKELLSEVPVKYMQLTDHRNPLEQFNIRFSTVGIPHIPNFVGREQELADIHQKLHSDGSNGTVVLQGLAGIGKTQLAVKYALQHQHDYAAVFWLDATDPSTLETSFVSMMNRILLADSSVEMLEGFIDDQISYLNKLLDSAKRFNTRLYNRAFSQNKRAFESLDVSDVVKVMKKWLNYPKNNRWLLVYDNFDATAYPPLDDYNQLRPFLPDAQQGHIIVTTASPGFYLGESIRIRGIGSEHGLKIMSLASERHDLGNDLHIHEVVEEMDGLPVALATAGRYLSQVSISCREYLELSRREWRRIQENSPELPAYKNKLYISWNISLREIAHRHEFSFRLVSVWVFFDSQNLWRELLHEPDEVYSLLEFADDPITFHEAMRVLCNYGLVEVASDPRNKTNESRGYNMPRPVHSWLTNEFSNILLHKPITAHYAFRCVGNYAQRLLDSQNYYDFCRFRPHAKRSMQLISEKLQAADVTKPSYALDFVGIGLAYLHGSDWALSRGHSVYLKVLRASSSEHNRDLIIAKNWLKLGLRRLEAFDETFHGTTAIILSSLADVYTGMHKFHKALRMRLLELRTRRENHDCSPAAYWHCIDDIFANCIDLLNPCITIGSILGSICVIYSFCTDPDLSNRDILFIIIWLFLMISAPGVLLRWKPRWLLVSVSIISTLCLEIHAWVWESPTTYHVARYIAWVLYLLIVGGMIYFEGVGQRESDV